MNQKKYLIQKDKSKNYNHKNYYKKNYQSKWKNN